MARPITKKRNPEKSQDRTYISCVGMRDPFDPDMPVCYGPALAGALAARSSRHVFITTSGARENANKVVRVLPQLVKGAQVELIEVEIKDPSDLAEVDVALRRALDEIARCSPEVIVNVSPGTPQMSICLSMLLATRFLRGTALRVARPHFDTAGQQITVGDPMTEPLEHAVARTNFVRDVNQPVVEHITRANAITLCQRFDYAGAETLLEQSRHRKRYQRLMLPLIRIGMELMVLHVASAREHFLEISPLIPALYEEAVTTFKKALEIPDVCLFYVITKYRLDTRRQDEFIRCAGLTREACLTHYLRLPSVQQLYENAIVKDGQRQVKISTTKLQECNPALLKFIEAYFIKQQGGKSQHTRSDANHDEDPQSPMLESCTPRLREELELTAGTMTPIIQFAGERDEALKPISDILVKTTDLSSIRNKFAHELHAPTRDEIEKVRSNFAQLRHALPITIGELEKTNPLKLLTSVITDMLQYWKD